MRRLRLPFGRFGMLLLSVWLIATGVLILAPAVFFARSGMLLAVLALAAESIIVLNG